MSRLEQSFTVQENERKSHHNIQRLTKLDGGQMFSMSEESRTRKPSFRIRSRLFWTGIGSNLFFQRMVSFWNSLPWTAVKAQSLCSFKPHIANFLDFKGINGYGSNAWKWC